MAKHRPRHRKHHRHRLSQQTQYLLTKERTKVKLPRQPQPMPERTPAQEAAQLLQRAQSGEKLPRRLLRRMETALR